MKRTTTFIRFPLLLLLAPWIVFSATAVPPPWEGHVTWLRRRTLPDGHVIWSTHMNGFEPAYDADASNAPLCGGKGQLLEGCVRVPFLVQWPGRKGLATLPFGARPRAKSPCPPTPRETFRCEA